MSNNYPKWSDIVNPVSSIPTIEWNAKPTLEPQTKVELEYSTEGMTPEQVEVLTAWEQVKVDLARLKKYELELRKCVVYDSGIFNAEKTSGIEHVALADGSTLDATKKENYVFINGKPALETALDNFSEELADLLVKWNPALSVSTYKQLSPEQQAHFNDCLEIRIGAPTLEIKAPKAKK